ncbi:sterol desaturase family protein [Pyxidicoccus sp. MSG2]|uniref:sterol desaturase family protein n=1 Tax=Pyxidicoccus sp. MSG2 TaxID=2996790 RepID=UPI00226FD600|nr:sterol desaturase family protein [Pyxidicoccus sp. MSG2]MCY1024036.1 sterol desaturase family protein [Pyxidicoccus sp. MSG2]
MDTSLAQTPDAARRPPLFLLYLPYPLVFFGGVAVLVAAVARGIPYWRVGPPVLVAAALVVVALELWLPHARAWQRDSGDTVTDVLHFTGNILVNQGSVLVYGPVLTLLHGSSGLWPHLWPFWLQALLGTAVLDLGLYVIHRTSHRVGWMWRLHAIHHSSRRVYWLNGQRRHLVHELLEGAPGLLALGLLGAPPSVVACALATVTLHLMFQHGNFAYRAGVLRYVFAVAELHRWHHQRRWADVQGNYGAILSLWDYLFGTALPKKGEAPLDVGMDDEPTLPQDYVGQLAWPFRRDRK